ncbi:ATP-grasp domain-containing protein [Amycolatopsis pithecellobii]|uniref:ATP-grasp domain-containing protein n=1 Tax=Amycolatopsis pithecellobii TaxID=664692 RepID=A0A6N7Z513_9PSEU|nr:ATP-grasp domain-containing protein [Amycolatopsis pithecellobii]MTD55520.1 ATP-grasp domain-containing protein [Amycolatopsis pithecellobii]
MTTHHPRPTVVLVYQRISLPWVFESAERAGIDLVLIPRPDEAVSEDRLPPAVVDVLRLDIEADRAAALNVLRRRYEQNTFQGIVTLYDPAVPFVAEAAELLGLPGIGRDVALGAQDKRVMRARLAAAGLNVPGFVRLDDPADWEKAASLAFPVVVKPAHGFSSLGVTKAESPHSLKSVVDQVWQTCASKLGQVDGLVVEEYLDGPEFAVESLAHGGDVRMLTIGYKGDPQGPHFEEGVYRAPAALSETVQDDICREVKAAHRALGITDGPTHTELRLRGGVTPYLLEIGARIGGSGVSQYIASGVTGIDFAAQALRIAAGIATEPLGSGTLPAPVAAAANYIVPCNGSGRIIAIHGLDELRADPRVDHVVQMLFPGDIVRPYPDFTGYPAFVLSRHANIAEAEEFHQFLDQAIRIDYGHEEQA